MSPERSQHSSKGLASQPLKDQVGRPAQAIPPLRVTNAEAVVESLENFILVEEGKIEGGRQLTPEGCLPACGKAGDDDEAAQDLKVQELDRFETGIRKASILYSSPGRKLTVIKSGTWQLQGPLTVSV